MAAPRWVMLFALAVLTAVVASWIASDRERLTKRERSITVEVTDPFGDPLKRVEFEQGPIFGYFIGLDAVGATAAAGVIATGVAWILARRRAGRETIAMRRET